MKIFFSLLIALFAIVLNSFAQGTWTQKVDLGGSARNGAVGFSIGTKGYIGTGVKDNGVNVIKDFWEYDPALDVWTQKADFGGLGRSFAVGFSIGDKGYVGTGEDENWNVFKDFWKYDPLLNSWTQVADLTDSGRGGAVGFSISSKGYVGLGWDGGILQKNDFWEYDPTLNTWVQKADFGGSAGTSAVGFSIGYKGYVGTGRGSGSQDFWEYDPDANSWEQKSDFGGSLRLSAVGFSIGAKGYIGTGCNDEFYWDFFIDFWEYDPSTNSWVQKADFGGHERCGAVGFSIGSKGYIGAGTYWSQFGTDQDLKDFWEYTPDDVGIGSLNNDTFSLSVSPNPAKDHFTMGLSTQANENGTAIITITDVLGKPMLQQESQITQGKLNEEIHLNEQFTAGLYLVRIKVGDAFFTQPLIVQR